MRTLYPMMADISGKRCLVVGGGAVAERKIAGLLQADAQVVVVSPRATKAIAEWQAAGRLELILRMYECGDGEEAALVFACTDDAETNVRVHADAMLRGQPINVADRPDLCTFVVPAVWRKGHLLVAVSTSGTSPLAASRLRDRIGQAIGEEIDGFLEFAAAYRKDVFRVTSDPERRKRLLAELFSDEALDAVQAGNWADMKETMAAKLNEASAASSSDP
ncbi:MAG: siroheme synthase [Paenibacillus sp.]|nr:siroheme synthase [Paenibacillus sp.]